MLIPFCFLIYVLVEEVVCEISYICNLVYFHIIMICIIFLCICACNNIINIFKVLTMKKTPLFLYYMEKV